MGMVIGAARASTRPKQVILNERSEVKNLKVLWDTSASFSVTRLLLKAQSIILKCKGHSFLFLALRSGHFNGTANNIALSSYGAKGDWWVQYWMAVRPAHELTCYCHSARARSAKVCEVITLFKVYQLAQSDSEESRSIVGHFTYVQCDR